MFEFKFHDYEKSKYIRIDGFHEGLASVKNREGLCGFINKEGKEVIPCQFEEVSDFHEGLAAVQDETELWGFIDKTGNLVIPCQFKKVRNFKEGLAVVQDKDYKSGYVDQKGDIVIPLQFAEAYDFCDGVAVVELENSNCGYVSPTGDLLSVYEWCSSFEDGYAVVKSRDKSCYKIDRSFQKKEHLRIENICSVTGRKCGMIKVTDTKGKVGYLGDSLNLKIPCMFMSGELFVEDRAIVQFSSDTIGFVTKEGISTIFSRKCQYKEIKDFREGMAAVQNSYGLWGFIDKSGKERILCQYSDVDSFSEGLACVADANGFYYINKRGTKKITVPKIYYSTLKFGEREISLSADSKADLQEKKMKALEQVKQQLIQEVTEDVAIAVSALEDKPKVFEKK